MPKWEYYVLDVWHELGYKLKDRKFQQERSLDPEEDWRDGRSAWLAWHPLRKVTTYDFVVFNALGEEGWELAGIHHPDNYDTGYAEARYVFKRPV